MRLKWQKHKEGKMTEAIFGAMGFATLFVLFVVVPSRIQRRTMNERNND
jgi:hypothetical protein